LGQKSVWGINYAREISSIVAYKTYGLSLPPGIRFLISDN